MGVTGLWTVVSPCARPTKLETLNKKRLAVDASIWIYQFLKAVRDKEGNALRNSHVVGFFRRICKLLFVGILPVFVFDGGAPALKRATITARKRRREGRKEDAVRTAGKLLALQMQRAAEEEEGKRKRREEGGREDEDEEEVVPEHGLVYAEEVHMSAKERVQNRKFRKKDQYHLPDLDTSMQEMGAPNDPRIMSLEELEAYARQFDTGEDINVYDFSKIDFDSPFFTSLPASDRYNILNAARLRSRLRMGYSKDQLEAMFPNRMDFSRFQIERVTERNELTQRLMNINGMNDDAMWGINGTGRVAGEKGREYVLVKNDGVEGGWALGVVEGRDEGQQDKPIDVDELSKRIKREEEEDDNEQSEEDFEDVPIEGLNRLPKPVQGQPVDPVKKYIGQQRKGFGETRRPKSRPRRPKKTRQTTQVDDPESLFVADEGPEESSEEEAVEDNGDMDVDVDDEDDLNRAIAMSLQTDDAAENGDASAQNHDHILQVFQQKRVEDAPSFKGTAGTSGLAIARQVNARANRAPRAAIFQADSDSEEEADKPQLTAKPTRDQQLASKVSASIAEASKLKAKSSGPLPFEKLDLGKSLFGKKLEKIEANSAGGFEKAGDKKEESRPLPPWFAGNPDQEIKQQEAIEKADREKAKQYDDEQRFQFAAPSVLKRTEAGEVIDVDAEESQNNRNEVLVLDDDEDEDEDESQQSAPAGDNKQSTEKPQDTTMGDMADQIKVAPPTAGIIPEDSLPPIIHDPAVHATEHEHRRRSEVATTDIDEVEKAPSDGEIDWSDSDKETASVSNAIDTALSTSATVPDDVPSLPSKARSRTASPDFEDVQIPDQPNRASEQAASLSAQIATTAPTIGHTSGLAAQSAPAADEEEEDYGLLTDSEDEDLMRQLEIEAAEHARFASTLNQKPQAQNVAEYERELKQLRTQQKKDRRDADEVTQIMITECQQLLRLFGLPYITAPMEAEAQCAELVRLKLVDGIVTDDSDCFLFGGTRVYKNMFNQAKFVECYLLQDLEKEFDLTRQKLIGVAQLLGSDYTEGVPGIGPVTALEILSEFGELGEFRDWWTGVQEGRVKKEDDIGVPFKKKFRKNVAKFFLPTGFPDPRVETAYLEPEVDSDPSEFQWGVPDLDALRSFLMATIGWSQERTDEVLVPVIRDMNKRQQEGTQSNITKFFIGGVGAGAYAPRVRAQEGSKRLGGALDRMAARAKRNKTSTNVDETVGPDAEGVSGADSAVTEPAPNTKRSRKRKSAADADGDDDEDTDLASAQPAGRKKRRAPARKQKAVVASEEES